MSGVSGGMNLYTSGVAYAQRGWVDVLMNDILKALFNELNSSIEFNS